MQGTYRNGEVLVNRFEILSLFKSTELTRAYFALDRATQKRVIVKCVCATGGYDRNSRIKLERLMVESQVLRLLNHPSVVRFVHAWGDLADFHLVTEYIDAKSMKETRETIPLTREMIIEYILQLLEVTEYLHYKGIVHRDIKPTNILISDNIMLLDFDASEAKFLNFEHSKVVIGTPGYQCPESFKGVISAQCDIYSIGATLLFLLTGENPSGDLSRFRNLSPYTDLLEIAFKAMNPNPINRFRTTFEMKQKLLSAAGCSTKLIIGNVQYFITKQSVIIGRGDAVDFKILDPSKFVSPIHAEINRVGNSFCLLDRSINGTYVYRRESYQKIDRWELLDGDVIVLCYSPSRGPHKIVKFRNITNN
jgi:serine/threonine protein kinase